MIVASIIFSHNPKSRLLQTLMGIELYRQGSSQKLYRVLNYLGLSLSNDASRSHADILSKGFDKRVVEWKENKEPAPAAPTARRLVFKTDASSAGYSICMDNVQFGQHAKHQSSTSSNSFQLMTLAYCEKHRIAHPPAVERPIVQTMSASDMSPGDRITKILSS